MTTPTKERVAQIARECGMSDSDNRHDDRTTYEGDEKALHAFALKVLAESEDRRDAERYRMALSGHCNIEICELDDEGEWYGLAAMKNAKQYCDEKLDAAIEAEKVRTE